MLPFRITLADHLLPVQAYLNCWPDNEYLPMLRRMAAGVESSYNDIGWSWWDGEDHEPPAQGTLCFHLRGEAIALPACEAMAYIEQATLSWVAHHPNSRVEAEALLGEIRRRYLLAA